MMMKRMFMVTVVILCICPTLPTLSMTDDDVQTQSRYSESQFPPARRMALSIVKALEKHDISADQNEQDEEVNADRIIQEVNAEYDNLAKQINQLNKEKRRLRNLQKDRKRRRRLAILRNLRQYYRRY